MIVSFSDILADAAKRLGDAVASARHPMHAPVVSTADGDLRTMVLREAKADLSLLRFHTDNRSPKATAIGGGARVSVLAYDPALRVQLRMRGIGRIEHTGAIADAAWEDMRTSSKRIYLASTAPGTPRESRGAALPDAMLHRAPTLLEAEAGRQWFAVFLVEVLSLDWLQLTHEGGIRARFERDSAALDWHATWLAP